MQNAFTRQPLSTLSRASLCELSEQDVQALINGTAVGVVEAVYPVELCADAVSHLKVPFSGYEVEPTFEKAGTASTLFEAGHSAESLTAYFNSATHDLTAMRTSMWPVMAPTDFLRLSFDEWWPAGFAIARLQAGRIANFAITRRFREGARVEPHTDRPDEDLPGNTVIESVEAFLAFNLYLEVAERGGELEVWGFSPKNQRHYNEFRVPGMYYLDRRLIGEPDVVVLPKRGSLVLFRADLTHAVRPIVSGQRIAVGGFLGYRGTTAPLLGHA